MQKNINEQKKAQARYYSRLLFKFFTIIRGGLSKFNTIEFLTDFWQEEISKKTN